MGRTNTCERYLMNTLVVFRQKLYVAKCIPGLTKYVFFGVMMVIGQDKTVCKSIHIGRCDVVLGFVLLLCDGYKRLWLTLDDRKWIEGGKIVHIKFYSYCETWIGMSSYFIIISFLKYVKCAVCLWNGSINLYGII